MMDIKLNDWKNSRVYRETREELRDEVRAEVKLEGKLEAVTPLLQRGFAVEEIAQILGLTVEQVQSVKSTAQ
jgi:predicted transposase/invertase (TIGR01784 family)